MGVTKSALKYDIYNRLQQMTPRKNCIETGFRMHLYFKNNLTLNSSSRSNKGHFEVNVKISEANSIEKRLFFLDPG